MGCAPSKESLREANRKAVERNLANDKDAMGHDKGIPRVTPNTPEAALMARQHYQSRSAANSFSASGAAAACAL